MNAADRLKLGFATTMFRAKRLFTGGRSMGKPAPAAAGRVHQFTLKTIDGKDRPLSAYKGRALLLVNTASECGLTPQYEGLQKLHEKYAGRGLAVVAFPANEFGAQEPGTNEQIKTFCSMKYRVTFDLFSKIVVKGAGIHPLYKFLTSESGFDGDIDWNFAKFLVDKNGTVIARFPAEQDPQSSAVVGAIEKALA